MLESKTLLYPHEFIARTDSDKTMTYYVRHLDPEEGTEQTEDEIEVPEGVFDRLLRMAHTESIRTIADALDPWREVPAGEYPPIASRIDDIYRLLEAAFTHSEPQEALPKKRKNESEPS